MRKVNRIPIALVCVVLAVAPASLASDAIWNSYFKSGRLALDGNKSSEAERLFKAALAEAKSDSLSELQSQALFALAQVSIKKKDYRDAAVYLAECDKLNKEMFGQIAPAVALTTEACADLSLLEGKVEDAETNYKKACKATKTGSDQETRLLSKLARLYRKQGKTIEAEALSHSAGPNDTTELTIEEYVRAFDATEIAMHKYNAPSRSTRATVTSSATGKTAADFGPYMADLQRKIKRAWFPPKGMESKRVSVVFTISSSGHLSGLRLDKSSGEALADQAGLKAIENASPFRPLPPGAPDHVSISFVFDYNVFAGGGRGVFRQF